MILENEKYLDWRILSDIFAAHGAAHISWNNKKYERQIEKYLSAMHHQFNIATESVEELDLEMLISRTVECYIYAVLEEECGDVLSKYFSPYSEEIDRGFLSMMLEETEKKDK